MANPTLALYERLQAAIKQMEEQAQQNEAERLSFLNDVKLLMHEHTKVRQENARLRNRVSPTKLDNMATKLKEALRE